MKLHDRNLLGFASSNSCIDREGFLYKRGEINKSFQKRWFVLKSNTCFYFDKRYDKEPMGVIVLENYTVQMDEENERPHCFKISFCDGGRDYHLSAESHELMELWIRSLSAASFVYMKLFVSELQQQVETLTRLNSDTCSRQKRVNPFHLAEECFSPGDTHQTFLGLHREVGRIICYDRANWRASIQTALIEL